MKSMAQPTQSLLDDDWLRIMTLSQDMLESARRQDWDRVCEIQGQRFALLRRYFETDPTLEDLERIRPSVSELLDMDREVGGLGQQARGKLADGLKALRSGKSARRAYAR